MRIDAENRNDPSIDKPDNKYLKFQKSIDLRNLINLWSVIEVFVISRLSLKFLS